MICNKCGKNNPAGADFCSSCKEPMSPLSNCGGFADILSFEGAPQATPSPTAPSAPVAAPQVSRRAVESHPSKKSSTEGFFSKKNIISLIAIGLCIITLVALLLFVCIGDSGNDVAEPHEAQETSQGEPEEPLTPDIPAPEVKTIRIIAEDLPAIPEEKDSVTMTIVDDMGEAVEFKINDQYYKEEGFYLSREILSTEIEVVEIEMEADTELPSGYAFIIKYDSVPQVKVLITGEVTPFGESVVGSSGGENEEFDDDDDDDDALVTKTGEINLSKLGFKEKEGTRVAVYFNNKQVNKETEAALYKVGGNMIVPIKVDVPRGEDSVEVTVKYNNVTKKNVIVTDLKKLAEV